MRFNILNNSNSIKRCLLPLLAIALLSQGCASSSRNNKRLERYQPVVAHRNYQAPKKEVKETPKKTEKVKKTEQKKVVKSAPKKTANVDKIKIVEKKPVEKKPVASKPVEKKPAPVASVDTTADGGNVKVQRMRKLKHGDMVTVGLYGIPDQIEVKESIDNFGSISLPLIDVINIVGLGTSAAERKIRDAYINSGFYTDLSVVVMAMADEYFIRGEVKKVGNYPLIGDRTLLQAITSAGGYTDYAKLSKVTILRDKQDPMVFNCQRIAKRRDPDPLIHPGDIIIIPRRILWK